MQVVFYEVQPGSQYIGGESAPAGQMWIRGDIRSGRTEDVKRKMIERLLDDVCRVTDAAKKDVWVYISDIPASNIAEYGRVLPTPGQETDWLATFPEGLRNKLLALG